LLLYPPFASVVLFILKTEYDIVHYIYSTVQCSQAIIPSIGGCDIPIHKTIPIHKMQCQSDPSTCLEFTAMVYPPQDYVSSTSTETGKPNSAFDQECREYTDKDQLNALVAELNDTSCPLPILCEHEPNTTAGHVKCAKLTPGRGILVTMSLDTSTEHGKRAADKVASGEWAYVSLGHEFLATRKSVGGNVNGAQNGKDHGYDIKKTAREVSCCALGARNQTAIIERLDESKWQQHAAKSGVVMSSAAAAQRLHANGTDGKDAIPIGTSAPLAPGVQKDQYSFRNVLIGSVIASSVSKPSMTDNDQLNQELNAEAAAPASDTPSNVPVASEAAAEDNNTNTNNTQDTLVPSEVTEAGAAAANATGAAVDEAAAAPSETAAANEQDTIELLQEANEALGRLSQEKEKNAALVKQLQDQLKEKEEISQRQARELKEKQDKEIATRRTDLKARLAALKQTEQIVNQVGMVEASAIVSDKMDIDQSEHIVNALEKATEGYIAASDSKKQLQQQLSDMSSAVGIVADAQRENKIADNANKRKAEDIVDPAALAAQGTVNASADGNAAAPDNGLPVHTSQFMAGKISYDELSRACEAQRDAESGMRVRQLSGSVNASADAAAASSAPSLGLGITGGFSASAHTAYSQYCNTNARRLLPPTSEMRQDCRGMGLKQVFPGIWEEFMQINDSFEKTGVPNYVKGSIMASMNTYEHKRRNGESRLELNDTMPPPPGGNVRPRQNRELEH